jgi:selenide, water dikinase
LGPSQLTEVLRQLPPTSHPNLLVGFEHKDDAGVFVLSEDRALVQTLDFFTPVVDDPYDYGRIAAANALSDVYAMGGMPLTVMNIACFDPEAAPADVWAAVLRGMFDQCTLAGALVVGGHSVEDKEPKFGMSVTGEVNPKRVFANTNAGVGDRIFLSKPLGTGIVTTAAKFDDCSPEELAAAVEAMATLNREAAIAAQAVDARCATDITGFGLAGHLFNIAKASGVGIELFASKLPILPGVERMVLAGNITGGSRKNIAYLGDALSFAEAVPEWLRQVILDPQTSGGLAVLSKVPVAGSVEIGRVVEGPARIQIEG